MVMMTSRFMRGGNSKCGASRDIVIFALEQDFCVAQRQVTGAWTIFSGEGVYIVFSMAWGVHGYLSEV